VASAGGLNASDQRLSQAGSRLSDNATQREYKALSQNIGHEHAMTTYNSYGTLTEDEQLETVAGIGRSNPDLRNASTESLLAEFSRRAGV
jgi:hypothetical protein